MNEPEPNVNSKLQPALANGVPPANIIPIGGEIPSEEGWLEGNLPNHEESVDLQEEEDLALRDPTPDDLKRWREQGAEEQERSLVEGLLLTGNDSAPEIVND